MWLGKEIADFWSEIAIFAWKVPKKKVHFFGKMRPVWVFMGRNGTPPPISGSPDAVREVLSPRNAGRRASCRFPVGNFVVFA